MGGRHCFYRGQNLDEGGTGKRGDWQEKRDLLSSRRFEAVDDDDEMKKSLLRITTHIATLTI